MRLLRPPSHRGPLIAAGAVALTVGVLLQQIRVDDLAPGWQLLLCGALAGVFLWLAVAAPLEGGRPPAYQSVLIVCALLNLAPALVALAEVLGDERDDGLSSSTSTLVLATLAGVAGLLAARRNSGIAAFLSAVTGAAAVQFLTRWVADPGGDTFRILSLLIATTLVVLSLVLRGARPRHSEQLVNAAGLVILAVPLAPLFTAAFGVFSDDGAGPDLLSGFWEVVVLAAGLGLVAYAAADRTPGPAYLGAANLAAFGAVTSIGADDTLRWWPFLLLSVGGLMLLAGLRPARPLPPEPPAYTKDDLPLHSRVEGEETIFTVRD